VGLRRVKHRLLQSAVGCATLAEVGGDDDRRARAASTEPGDDPRHSLRRRSDHRKVWNLRQARDVGINGHAVDRPMMRVYQRGCVRTRVWAGPDATGF